MEHINNMFKHEGKTASVIGNTRVKTYQELYFHLNEMQKTGEIQVHDNYLGDNPLAKTIYEKKYFIKGVIIACYQILIWNLLHLIFI